MADYRYKRQFTRTIFFGGTEWEKDMKNLHILIDTAGILMSGLQQPAHSTCQEDADYAAKMHIEGTEDLALMRLDIAVALGAETK